MRSSTKFMQNYKQRFILTGHRVKWVKDGRRTSRRVLGVRAEDGALLLEAKNREHDVVTSPSEIIIPKQIKLPKKQNNNV